MEAFLERFGAKMADDAAKVCANTLSIIASREMKAAASAMEKHILSVAEATMGQVAEEAVERFVQGETFSYLNAQKRKRIAAPSNKKNHHAQALGFILEPLRLDGRMVHLFKV
jgi:hypothetical protein